MTRAPHTASTTAPPPLSVEGMTLSYDRTPVVEDVTLRLEPGRLVGILGPNGAGKSTLFKGILGLLPLDTGEARFWGQPLARVRQRVVYVPQRGSVDWDFPVTVEDVVRMGRYGRLGLLGRLRGEDKRAAQEAMEQMGIADLAKRQISAMSGGQQQRVFLARALAQDGDLLFMDEPFVGVDAATEEAIVALLRAMKDQGKTVVVVNHDLQTARTYFDDLLLLNRRVVAFGPSAEIFTADQLARAYGGRLAVLTPSEGDAEVILAR